MKKYLKHLYNISPELLAWLIPILLIIPNVILDITEYSHPVIKVLNILLPYGIYMVVIGLSRCVGRTGLLLYPVMFIAGFQIVLIYLYGESIIAVDMFLNMVTTSMSEATELLSNLLLAIVCVVVLYLVPVVCCILMLKQKLLAKAAAIKLIRRIGIYSVSISALLVGVAYIVLPNFNLVRAVFPFNVVNNLCYAVERAAATQNYASTSADFHYNAKSTHNGSQKEIYVLVIGETSRADNWQLFGYDRPTNPCLSKRDSILTFPKVLSESNTTYKSVPLMLSWVDNSNFCDSIYSSKSVITAFNEAGFSTAYLSNQARNHSFIDYFANEADVKQFLRDDSQPHYDHELLAPFNKIVTDKDGKIFIVLHTYGGHFNYKDRYTPDYAVFTPDESKSASIDNLEQLINGFDNTIVYTDAFLDKVISALDAQDCPAAMIYVSDHGEDIFDDKRHRILHSSPVPTYYQIHVPLIMWMSHEYTSTYPEKYADAKNNSDMDASSSEIVFDTLLDLAGVTTDYSNSRKSIVSHEYKPYERRYLNDYNEGVPLKYSGLRNYDFDKLQQKHISIN